MTDVSSIGSTSRRNKAEIAVAGVIFQTAVSTALLLFPSAAVRTAATLSLLSAAFALTPLPGSDGYWFLSDISGSRIVGSFGKEGRTDWVGFSYTAFLLTLTSYLVFKLCHLGYLLTAHSLQYFATNTGSSLAQALIAAYVYIAAILFVRRITLFLKSGDTATT